MKAKINLNYKATAYIDGKPSIVFANREAKKRFDDPPKYFCCGTDKSGEPCLAPMHLKTSINGKHFFSAGNKVKHKKGCEYSKSTGKHEYRQTTHDVTQINIDDLFDKFSAPTIEKDILSSPSTPGKGATPNADSASDEEHIEILGKDKLPNSLASLYDILSDNVHSSTPTADGVFPEEVIVNRDTFLDFYNQPENLYGKKAICVCFFRYFGKDGYKNKPDDKGDFIFTLVYPRGTSGKKGIHYCLAFKSQELLDAFKKEYKEKQRFDPVLVFAEWEKVKNDDGDKVFVAEIPSLKMFGRIESDYKKDVEKGFPN